MTALIKPAVPATSRRFDWLRERRGSLIFVALPTLLAAFYYFFVAADLYASEASFVVRSPSRMQIGGLAGLLQSSAAGGHEDAYSVQAFVTSRDVLAILSKKLDLKAIFSRPEGDFFARYPNPLDWDSDEDFYRFFQRRVELTYDTTTDISTLIVKTFRAEDSQKIADILLSESEALVNRLNQRGHDNAVRDAETDVKRAEDAIVGAQKSMLEYRTRESLLDPRKTSGAIFETQARTEAELASTRTRLNELLRTSPESPMRGDLETHIHALEQQIASERSSLTGSNGAIAPKLSEYEQLSLHEDFATKELASALASLEAARAESRRQQVYLERVVDTSLPDKALYPKRLVSVLIVFVSAFLIYSIGLLLLAGVREHAQQ
jgi:capsular polysaccharide transport system permease protein